MQRVTLTNANLIDPDLGSRPGATISIVGDRIEAVSYEPRPSPQPDARVVDLQGRSVMPGMFNCHYHASYHELGKNGAFLPIGMEAPPALQTLRAARHLEQALEAGFTGVISAGAPYAIDASLKIAVEEGSIKGPRIMAGSRDVSTTGHSQDSRYPWYWDGAAPGIQRCDGPEEFRRGVREEIKRGAEIIKIFATTGHAVLGPPGDMELTREELAAAIEAAHQRGALIRGHIANRNAILTAVELGMDVIDHGDGLDDLCIERMLAAGTFIAPSMLFPYRIGQVRKGPIVDEMLAEMNKMLEVLPRANKAGLKIVLGDDFGAEPLAHGDYADELEFYVKVVGIPALDVIRWATRHGAEMMRRGHELGSIRVGALADLLIINGDPLADISILKDTGNLLAIVKNGKFFKDDLATLEAPARANLSFA